MNSNNYDYNFGYQGLGIQSGLQNQPTKPITFGENIDRKIKFHQEALSKLELLREKCDKASLLDMGVEEFKRYFSDAVI